MLRSARRLAGRYSFPSIWSSTQRSRLTLSAHLVLTAALFRHTVGLFAAYVVGVGPAAATAFLYALCDAAAPARLPRALVAAVIGGLIAYGLAVCLAPYIASVEADPGSRPAERIDPALLDRLK